MTLRLGASGRQRSLGRSFERRAKVRNWPIPEVNSGGLEDRINYHRATGVMTPLRARDPWAPCKHHLFATSLSVMDR